MRMTVQEARRLGLIPPKPANDGANKTPRRIPKPLAGDHAGNALLQLIHRQSPPQATLSIAAMDAFGDRVVIDSHEPIPGRRFRLDIAFPDCLLAIEVNGWSNHGKTLGAFKSDHERTRLLVLHGWTILPFTAGEASKETAQCIDTIRQVLDMLDETAAPETEVMRPS